MPDKRNAGGYQTLAQPAPQVTLDHQEDFEDGVADHFQVESGLANVEAGRYLLPGTATGQRETIAPETVRETGDGWCVESQH